MLDQRRRRWSNIKPTVLQRLVFVVILSVTHQRQNIEPCWASVGDGGQTLSHHCFNILFAGVQATNTTRSHNVGLMLATVHDAEPAFNQHLLSVLFAG